MTENTDPKSDAVELDALLAERGARYGKFADHALITQMLKAVMSGDWAKVHALSYPGESTATLRERLKTVWKSMASDQHEALEMNAHKVGRIINGDPNYADSWDDIAGYAKLVGDRLRGVSR